MNEPNYLLRMIFGGDPVESFDSRGPIELTKVVPFDDGGADIPDFATQFFRKAELGLLGGSKTQPVNPAAERFRQEQAVINGRFAKIYQGIAKSESDEAAEIFGRKSGDRLAKAAPLQLFIRLSKIDEEQRLVYGIATAEVPDRDGEICDYQESKPHFQAWSESVQKDSQGKSKGNLREMHQLSAVGTLSQIQFNDTAKQIEICAQITDDAAWKKVKTGTYVGFSVGGRYSRRWQDAGTNLTRYAAIPAEISLVDRPCVPNATISMVKADGSVQEILGLVNA
jgi:hypothetical protein